MKAIKLPMAAIILGMSLTSFMAFGKTMESANSDRLTLLQQRWAEVNYQLTGDAQTQGFDSLVADTEQWLEQEPNNPEVLIWLGIIKSTYAGQKGGLGALSLAKQARKALQQAITIKPDALEGSAYASLGTLYYKVPGWPFGFGDDEKAQQFLEKALTINPDGIDPNYFYADYWFEQGDYAKARHYAEKALSAVARPLRPLADKARRDEIEQLMAKIERQR